MLTPEEMDMQAEAIAAQQLPSGPSGPSGPMEQREMLAAMKAEVLQRLTASGPAPAFRAPAQVPPRPGMAQIAPVPLAQQGQRGGQWPAPQLAGATGRPHLSPSHPSPSALPAFGENRQGSMPMPLPAVSQTVAAVSAQAQTKDKEWKQWKSEPFVLLGDVAWFPVPKAKVRGDFPLEAPEDSEAMSFLRRVTSLMGCEITEQMREEPEKAVFQEAARLLLAVVGFMCEGNCPHMLRGNVVTRAPFLPAWQGVVPHMVLREWFDGNEATSLLNFYGSDTLRKAFEAADRPKQGHFITLLSRCAAVEAGRPGARYLRAAWQKIFDLFPELSLFRQLLAQLRRRCWEDVRDRSRSRSPRRKPPAAATAAQPEEEGTRFILRNAGQITEEQIIEYFQHFGRVVSCNVLKDKRTKKSRGVAFCTLRAEGSFEGQPITEESMKEWVLHETHIVGHMKLEITEAEVKQEKEDDEDKKREERVEERRRSRIEKEQRQLRTLGGAATLQEKGEEKLVPSHWLRRWRQQLWESLPKGNPVVWAEPIVSQLCSAIWSEVAEHGLRFGDRAVNDAVGMFQDPSQEGRWSFIPAAELLLTVGEGLVGITALGLFVWPTWQEPIPPRSAFDLTALTRPNFAPPPGTMGAMGAMGAGPMGPGPMGPMAGHIMQQSMSGMGMPKGSDREKIFVGGIPHHCTLEMLANYFSRYGRITDAVVMMDKTTGKPRGFGFVVFEHVSCVEAIDGKWVDVKRATPQDGSAPVTSTPVSDEGVAGASPERQNFRELPSQLGGATSPEQFKVLPPGGAANASSASPDRGIDTNVAPQGANGALHGANFSQVPPPAM
ncbi:unnamed protein product [Cladocopium goreaui]|uniref:Calcium-dependent protein kinase 2 n=1 Tax=Cladocopium goreaui TaxID=2562237 RepID=A0A9P1DDR1_9DINO|nr:unnamed protein product [Cladocopium goreaui]